LETLHTENGKEDESEAQEEEDAQESLARHEQGLNQLLHLGHPVDCAQWSKDAESP